MSGLGMLSNYSNDSATSEDEAPRVPRKSLTSLKIPEDDELPPAPAEQPKKKKKSYQDLFVKQSKDEADSNQDEDKERKHKKKSKSDSSGNDQKLVDEFGRDISHLSDKAKPGKEKKRKEEPREEREERGNDKRSDERGDKPRDKREGRREDRGDKREAKREDKREDKRDDKRDDKRADRSTDKRSGDRRESIHKAERNERKVDEKRVDQQRGDEKRGDFNSGGKRRDDRRDRDERRGGADDRRGRGGWRGRGRGGDFGGRSNRGGCREWRDKHDEKQDDYEEYRKRRYGGEKWGEKGNIDIEGVQADDSLPSGVDSTIAKQLHAQKEKRKALWGAPLKKEGEAAAAPRTSWGAGCVKDADDEQTAKFLKLMGVKGVNADNVKDFKTDESVLKSSEVVSSFEEQYEKSRYAHHLNKGVGLGVVQYNVYPPANN